MHQEIQIIQYVCPNDLKKQNIFRFSFHISYVEFTDSHFIIPVQELIKKNAHPFKKMITQLI